MRKPPSLDIRTLRRQVEDTGATIHLQGSQWILCGRKTERLGYSIKTERDALEFTLDRAKQRETTRIAAGNPANTSWISS
jgi:hypothetical protein